jgi:anti-sigma B factor antagonist
MERERVSISLQKLGPAPFSLVRKGKNDDMERMPESRSDSLPLFLGVPEEPAGWFGTPSQPKWSGAISAPSAPGDITQTCDPNDLASFRVERMSQGAVVVASGEIDIATAPSLREALLTASRASTRVVLDLTGVTFLDSSGLAVLIQVLKSGDQEQQVSPRLVGPRLLVRRVLDITRLSQKLPIHETVVEALEQAI